MYKTIPRVIFEFEFRTHFGGGQTIVLEKTLESLSWLWHDLRFLGLREEQQVQTKTCKTWPVWEEKDLKKTAKGTQEQNEESSVQFSRSVVWPHGLQHARPPCPSPTPRVYPNSSPLSQWCHPTISSSVIPFSHLQSFPASRSFQMNELFTSGGQTIGVSASTSVLPMNTQDWFPLAWTGWSPCSPRDSQESSPTPQFKSINSSVLSFL